MARKVGIIFLWGLKKRADSDKLINFTSLDKSTNNRE